MTANTLLKPRDYQLECIRAIHQKWDAGIWRPASVLPTGAGKTVIFAYLAEEFLIVNPTARVLILAHTDELVLQSAAKFRQVAPYRTVGIVKAERNEVSAQVICASVQTLRSLKRREALKGVKLIIVDECHHGVAKTYRTILEHFSALATKDAPEDWAPSCLVAGFTATLVRADKEKLSDVWQDVAYRKDIAFMIRRGYLLDVKGHRVVIPDFDLSRVRTSGGDYAEGALGEALEESLAPEIVAKSWLEHASERKTLVFAPTVHSAYAFEEAFRDLGVTCETVHGALPRDERRAILARLRSGETRVVTNCMVLTEGFDDPTVSCAVIARPTKSAGLYQQMVGRVLRPDLSVPASDRGHALVMDVVGISRRHDLRSLIDLSSREDRERLEDLPELEELSLLELEDLEILEEGSGGGSFPESFYVGDVAVEDFDPLARNSERTWQRTAAGTYWMPAGGDGYVFLTDSLEGDPGTFDVVWCAKEHKGPGSAGMTEHRGLSFEMALSWAEEEATERGGHGTLTLTRKSSGWRKRPASNGQKYKARGLGIDFPKDILSGDLSDRIGSVLATRRIDPLVAVVMAGRKK